MLTTRDRLLVFFACNPDEELTCRDMQAKFDTTYDAVWSCLNAMARADLVVFRVESDDPRGRRYFSAGPALKDMLS